MLHEGALTMRINRYFMLDEQIPGVDSMKQVCLDINLVSNIASAKTIATTLLELILHSFYTYKAVPSMTSLI